MKKLTIKNKWAKDVCYDKNEKLNNENITVKIGKNDYQEYRTNDKLHRIDGPAVIWGWEYGYAWYINGNEINNKIMDNWLKENDIPLDWNIWTDSDKKRFANYWSDYQF